MCFALPAPFPFLSPAVSFGACVADLAPAPVAKRGEEGGLLRPLLSVHPPFLFLTAPDEATVRGNHRFEANPLPLHTFSVSVLANFIVTPQLRERERKRRENRLSFFPFSAPFVSAARAVLPPTPTPSAPLFPPCFSLPP